MGSTVRALLVAHCNLHENSGIHVLSLATALGRRGHDCTILVRDPVQDAAAGTEAGVVISDHEAARRGALRFDLRPPDLIHAWSPREHVRGLVQSLHRLTAAPFIVHMEDNEEQIIAENFNALPYEQFKDLPDRVLQRVIPFTMSHPRHYRNFLDQASGYSCLIKSLMDFKPKHVPGVVFWAGYDEKLLPSGQAFDRSARQRFGLDQNDIVLLYSGNIHRLTRPEIQNLYVAVALLRRRGYPVKLLKTGYNEVPVGLPHHEIDEFVIDLGFVSRDEIRTLLAIADILVQPGTSNPFNDYRFPAKLADYLASGKPVVLPRTNIGLELRDEDTALLLSTGTSREIADKVERLIKDPELGKQIGARSQAFARERLSWAAAAETLESFYQQVAANAAMARKPVTGAKESPATVTGPDVPAAAPRGTSSMTEIPQTWDAVGADFRWLAEPLVKIVGFWTWTDGWSRTQDLTRQAELAKAHGFYGFCHDYHPVQSQALLAADGASFPFCIAWRAAAQSADGTGADQRYEEIACLAPFLANDRYIRVDGAPLLLVHDAHALADPLRAIARWRTVFARRGIARVVFAMVGSIGSGDPRSHGFDAAVEFPFASLLPPAESRESGGGTEDASAMPEDYIDMVLGSLHQPTAGYVRFRGVVLGDEGREPERKAFLRNRSPKAFAEWLRFAVREALVQADQREPLIFVSGWYENNGRSNGTQRPGSAYLTATADALCQGIVDHILGPKPETLRAFAARFDRPLATRTAGDPTRTDRPGEDDDLCAPGASKTA